ncbi:MAG: hypothetical protein ACFE85_14125 [Candidatus Hodarchaeota archaeon]
MNLRKYLDFRILGLTGSIFMIISEFLSWSSELSLLSIYIFSASVAIGDSFLYLFPLICGIICLFGSCLLIYKIEYRINSVIIYFIGLGFFLVFVLNIIIKDLIYIPTIQFGFYFLVIGVILVFFEVLNILLIK